MRSRLLFHYISDRKMWILLYFFSLLILNSIFWLDDGIIVDKISIMYINIVLIFLFILFFCWRFIAETRYVQQLHQLMTNEELIADALPQAKYYEDEQYNELLRKLLYRQSQQLQQVKDENVMAHDYTAAWVHEVKTPLTAMKLIIDDAKHDPLMRKMEAEWLRIHLLLDQQLSITRLPTLQSDYIVRHVDVQKMVAQEVKELASWCLEKQIAVEFEGEEETAVTDEKWARFIIRQLLTNAIKYSPQGGTIVIHFEVVDERFKRISIVDEGPGIATHDQPRVFEKGYTGSTGRLHNAATGLGLYLAKSVAERLKIQLLIQSTEGHGTTAIMTFPTENDFDHIVT